MYHLTGYEKVAAYPSFLEKDPLHKGEPTMDPPFVLRGRGASSGNLPPRAGRSGLLIAEAILRLYSLVGTSLLLALLSMILQP